MNLGRYTLPIAVLAVAATFAFGEWIRQPPPVRPATAPSDQFSAERASRVLRHVLQERVPHPVGSAANRRVREHIEEFLTRNGIDYEIQETWGCSAGFSRCAWVENVIGRIPGERPGPYVALMAHYDSVPMAPGAGDDGLGLAALLESARILRNEGPHRNPMLLVITDAEEMGLLGAEAFFGQHRLAKQVGVVLNIEGAGTTGVSQVLRTHGGNAALMSMYRHAVAYPAANSLTDEIFRRMPNDTDFSVSTRAGIAGVDFAFAGEFTHYHTANDNLDNVDWRTLQHHGENLLPLARGLLGTDLTQLQQDADSDIVYFQLLGLWVDWPVWANSVLLAIAALALAGAAFKTGAHHAGWRQLLLALTAPLVVMVAACFTGLVAFKSIQWLNGTTVAWPAVLWPYRLVLFGAPVAGAGAIVLWLNRYMELAPALIGAWLWWWLTGLLATLFMPGAAGLILCPLVIAAILLLGATVVESIVLRSALVIATLVAATTQTLGIVLPLEASQGYNIIFATFPFLALFLAVLAPLVRGRGAVLFPGIALLAAAAGIVGAVSTPLYSTWRPQHVNIQFVENVDSGTAFAYLSTPNTVPERMVSTMPFGEAGPVYPWSDWQPDVVAGVARSGWAAPEVRVLADEVVDGSRTLDLELKVIRRARLVQFVLPGEVEAEAFRIDDIDIPVAKVEWQSYKDRYVIMLMGMNERPVRLHLKLKNPAPFDAWLADVSTRLPNSVQPLFEARPPLGVAVHQGDTAMLVRKVRL